MACARVVLYVTGQIVNRGKREERTEEELEECISRIIELEQYTMYIYTLLNN